MGQSINFPILLFTLLYFNSNSRARPTDLSAEPGPRFRGTPQGRSRIKRELMRYPALSSTRSVPGIVFLNSGHYRPRVAPSTGAFRAGTRLMDNCLYLAGVHPPQRGRLVKRDWRLARKRAASERLRGIPACRALAARNQGRCLAFQAREIITRSRDVVQKGGKAYALSRGPPWDSAQSK